MTRLLTSGYSAPYTGCLGTGEYRWCLNEGDVLPDDRLQGFLSRTTETKTDNTEESS
jgi:hypothetical protein